MQNLQPEMPERCLETRILNPEFGIRNLPRYVRNCNAEIVCGIFLTWL